MIFIDVCMETVFEDTDYCDRPAKVADAGFKALEIWFPELHIKDGKFARLRQACEKANIRINNMVANAPDGSIGGSLSHPKDRDQYLKRVEDSLKVADELNTKMMITCTGNKHPDLDAATQRQSIIDGLKLAGDLAARQDVTLVLEPLNSLIDHAGYCIDLPEEAAAIVREVAHPNIKMLYDIYHMQIMRGHVIETIRANLDIIGHFHSAGVPGRHELDSGELDYPRILQAIADMGYSGSFGLEYFPLEESATSLKRMRQLLPDRG